MTTTNETASTRRSGGPNPGILAIVSLALTLIGVLLPVFITGGQSIISPLESTADVAHFYTAYPAAASLAGFFTFAVSVPLGIYAATAYARLLKLGVRVPGPGIAFFGGISASVFLALSGLISWVLGQPIADQSPATIHTFAYLSYTLGGIGFVGGVGLLIAGIAVPALILRLTPRWFAWTGLVIATIAELGFFAMLLPQFSIALPIGRFLGLLWLVVAGFLLPQNRHEVSRTSGSEGAGR